MKLINACVVWCPADRPGPLAGDVKVAIPQSPETSFDYPISVGNFFLGWSDLTDAHRKELLRQYFTTMVKEDGVPEARARAELARIEDVTPEDIYFVEFDPIKSWDWFANRILEIVNSAVDDPFEAEVK